MIYQKNNSKILVANWKMFKSHDQALVWVNEYLTSLHELVQKKQCSVVLCPPATSITNIHAQLSTYKNISLGAQSCSRFESGAHTGELSAQSLKEAGCSYCIIGHSEQRQEYQENNSIFAQKITQKIICALKAGLAPIFCIGETNNILENQEFALTKTLECLLEPIWEALKIYSQIQVVQEKITIIISYEPHWAIGTDNVPTVEKVAEIIDWLHNYCLEQYKKLDFKNQEVRFLFLYGGSINPQNIRDFLTIKLLSGFLIGRASLEYDSFAELIKRT